MLALLLLGLLSAVAGLEASTEQKGELCTKCDCSTKGRLDCSGKSLVDHFEDGLWKGSNWSEVSFDKNSLVHITKFPSARIVKLVLSHNEITMIDDAAFRNLTDLEELNLSHNHLTTEMLKPNVFQGTYSPDAYQPLKGLRKLWLDGNSLHSLHPDLFEHLPGLEALSLTGNPIKTIDVPTINAICSIYMLNYLDLSGTMIDEIPPTMLHTPRKLETLNISSNYFNHVPTALGAAQSLKTLVMDGNPIEVIKKVPKIDTLKEFHINNMPALRKLERNSLGGFSSLEILSCSHNEHLENFDELALFKNNDALPIKEIDLRYSKLGRLGANFIPRKEKVKVWNLSMNPWICDCKNTWMVDQLLPVINKTSPQEASRITCAEPPELRGKQLLELARESTDLRCLDAYGNRPEKDSLALVTTFAIVLTCIPLFIFGITLYVKSTRRTTPFSRFVYRRTDSLETLP